jgi:RNA polymerase sigma-70 factor (ECF subfamily)
MGFPVSERVPPFTSTRGLLESAVAGGAEAQVRLIARFEPLVRSLVWRHLGPARFRSEGEDALQVLRLALIRSLPRLKARDRAAFVAWLRKLVRSRVLDLDRRSRARGGGAVLDLDGTGAPEPAAGTPTPSRIVMDREELARMRAAIERVPERYRPVLRLIVEEEPTPVEVSAFLGKGGEASRKFVARALVHLRRELGPTGTTRIGR